MPAPSRPPSTASCATQALREQLVAAGQRGSAQFDVTRTGPQFVGDRRRADASEARGRRRRATATRSPVAPKLRPGCSRRELAARDRWSVEALTTCARDATTWADAYPPGHESVDGVDVHRFPVAGRRARRLRRAHRLVIVTRPASRDDEAAALAARSRARSHRRSSTRSRTSDADVVAFHPYLYHPTVVGLPLVARRAVLHPAAHDEPPLRLPMYRDAVRACGRASRTGATPNSDVVERHFAVAPEAAGRRRTRRRRGRRRRRRRTRTPSASATVPYLLCLGRVDDGKGAQLLAECFARYKERRPDRSRLVLAGPVVHAPPRAPRHRRRPASVDEPTKWGLLRGALALVSPSAFESFSIVLMEAWSVGTPVLVNGRCAVTRDHTLQFGRGSRVPFVSRVRGRVGTAARPRRPAPRWARAGQRIRRGALPLAGSRRSLRRLPRRDR